MEPDNLERKLIVVKLRHHTLEMVNSDHPEFDMKRAAYKEHDECLEEYFSFVREHIEESDVTRAYQDTHAGDDMIIWILMAARGSPNAQLLCDLVMDDVELEVTEDVGLVSEYLDTADRSEELGAKVRSRSTDENMNYVFELMADLLSLRAEKDRLIDERDAYIAEVIDSTLKTGETGVLFIGAGHYVEVALTDRGAYDIECISPPFQEEYLLKLDQYADLAIERLCNGT